MQKTIRYVSFDIYDTLVHRLFSTAQIYQMMERILNEEKITEHFAERRISAEQLLRDSGKVIYTLEDIYETKYFEKIPESGIKRIIYGKTDGAGKRYI